MTTSYEEVALEVAKLVAKKNQQYGDSFNNSHRILEVLYPDGVKVEQYRDMLAITRILDKLFRIAHDNQGDEDAFHDIMGYALLKVTSNREK
jgi:hypothetical protein